MVDLHGGRQLMTKRVTAQWVKRRLQAVGALQAVRIMLVGSAVLLSAVPMAPAQNNQPKSAQKPASPAGKMRAVNLLKPHKDALFSYQTPLKSADNGDYLILDYNEMRDINGRDAIVEKRVQDQYVSLKPRAQQRDMVVQTPAGAVKTYITGKPGAATGLIIIYLHGKGGSRHQGVNDYTFGGNFNRLKNLVIAAGGVYLSPDFSNFEQQGSAEIAGLITEMQQIAPHARVIVACGSAGGVLCWQLARDDQVSDQLDGLVLLGSLWDEGFKTSKAYRRRLPVFIAHGSRDPVFSIEQQEAFYRALRKNAGGYPVVLHRFETGNHGTPIRMADWKLAINWLLSR